MKIGYIGLGAMGSSLAGRLLAAHELTVWDLNPAAVAAFVQRGARSAEKAADLARACEVVVLCLPRSADVRQVVLGDGGLGEALSPGKLVIDQTSGTPAETREIAAQLAERGVAMVDAPVSGSPAMVAEGKGTIMASGEDAAYAQAEPVLHAMTGNLLRCGQRLGDAQAMKLVNNTMNAGCRLATLEVAALGRKLGLSLAQVHELVDREWAANRTSKAMLPALIAGKESTNFALALMLKDVVQATRMAQELGVPMPMAGITRGLHQVGVNTLGAQARLEDLVRLVESMAGTRIAGPAGSVSPVAPEVARALVAAAAACNAAITCECVVLGARFGLTLDAMDRVLNSSSGVNGASERLLPALVAGSEVQGLQLGPLLQDLQAAAAMATEQGAPMLLATEACSLCEVAIHAFGKEAGIGGLLRQAEASAGLRMR